MTMEQKFGINSIDIKVLCEFCKREGKEVTYRKGDQLEREGDPARWFGFVTEGVPLWKHLVYFFSVNTSQSGTKIDALYLSNTNESVQGVSANAIHGNSFWNGDILTIVRNLIGYCFEPFLFLLLILSAFPCYLHTFLRTTLGIKRLGNEDTSTDFALPFNLEFYCWHIFSTI